MGFPDKGRLGGGKTGSCLGCELSWVRESLPPSTPLHHQDIRPLSWLPETLFVTLREAFQHVNISSSGNVNLFKEIVLNPELTVCQVPGIPSKTAVCAFEEPASCREDRQERVKQMLIYKCI